MSDPAHGIISKFLLDQVTQLRSKLFEKLVNAIHAGAPGSRIAFNTNPDDTPEAVARWV